MGKSPDEVIKDFLRTPHGKATAEEKKRYNEAVELKRQLDALRHAADHLDLEALAAFMPLLPELRRAAGPLLSKKLEEKVQFAKEEFDKIEGLRALFKIESLRDLAKKLNAECRAYGFAIAHPVTGEPCTLLVVQDKTGGRFTLENRITKKRSHTTANIEDLLPFKLVPLSSET